MRESAVVMFSRLFDVDVCHDHKDNVWVPALAKKTLISPFALLGYSGRPFCGSASHAFPGLLACYCRSSREYVHVRQFRI
jgi:hypothetical protein